MDSSIAVAPLVAMEDCVDLRLRLKIAIGFAINAYLVVVDASRHLCHRQDGMQSVLLP
jgi:hypothetical protein